MGKLWNYETTSGTGSSHCNGTRVSKLINNSGRSDIIITTKITESVSHCNLELEDDLYDQWFITGLAMNIAHRIKEEQFEIVDPETVLHASASKLILDNDLLEQIKNMIGSSSDDKAMALSIIPNIDYTKNYHLLWQLANDCSHLSYADARNKNLKYWLEKSKFDFYGRKSAQDMILHLEKRELLNRDSFRHLEPIVRSEISIHNRDLYVFKVAVKNKYERNI